MNLITEKDYKNILEICFFINEYVDNYKIQVLEKISDQLGSGFDNLTFLEAQVNNRLGNSIGINSVKSSCKKYNLLFNDKDIFLNNLKDTHSQSKVKSIEDIMSFKDYEKTSYYNDFLKKENLYYELSIPLMHKSKLVGGIGIFREKSDKPFSNKDKEIFTILSRHLSLSYYNWLNLNNKLKYNCLKEKYGLTKTEQNIIKLVECGMTNREIANKKNISFHTVKAHVEHIFTKMQVHSRTEMIYQLSKIKKAN